MFNAVSFAPKNNVYFKSAQKTDMGFADPRTPDQQRKDMDEQMMYYMCLGAKLMRDALVPGKKEPDRLDKAVEKMGERQREKMLDRLLDPRMY